MSSFPGVGDTLITLAQVYVSASYAYADIAGLATQKELILHNTDGSNSVYIRDQTAVTTTQVGTILGPGQIAVLSTSAGIRLTNPNSANVIVNANRNCGMSP